MKKVFIATSREIGQKCIAWAQENTPNNYTIITDMNEADIIISVMYENIISSKIVKNKKCYNFHPGSLPEYRGSGIFSWVIINKERKMGITLHCMDEGMDTGDIIEIREFIIDEDDTAHSLFLRGESTIFKMFKDWYIDLLSENYVAIPQRKNEGKNYYLKDLRKTKNLSRFIKAFYFPGKESAYYYDEQSKKIYINYKKGN